MAEVGRKLFVLLLALQLLTVVVVTPGLTAGTISAERERGLLEQVLLSRVTPWGYVLGKLLPNVGLIMLACVATLPVAGIAFLLGGVSLPDALWCEGLVLATALALASIGLFCSAHFRRTPTAIAASYTASFLGVLALPVMVTFQDYMPYTMDEASGIAGVTLSFLLVGAVCGIIVTGFASLRGRLPSEGFVITLVPIFAAAALAATLLAWFMEGRDLVNVTMDELNNTPEYFLLGNPFGALLMQTRAWEEVYRGGWEYIPWTVVWTTPIAMGVLLLVAGLFARFAALRLEAQRREA
jgi:ABC-type Na+ efflux pump permease subunit